ncbi:hypothetical protein C1Y08_23455 [Pseudomonas sp. FW306-02-F02-AA]|jgi:hypothetical protein|uniref:Uncharacterized protein n=1 Tax=Pseudomonas fluorescens TaxID=294 RepID=A0A0N9X0R2_PSEFL|nr:hypothetical protein AO353_25085 [Pseudomonas fluorescens]PMZ03234.1 hypothetical protein C1Y07_15565 [Pseudomonas sp. FW306-02-F02-AB]PMZ07792.1 hypothetical protein C1Y06_22830 [Pseudomonas sp. FW306-02-H06C]PMZ13506.1 hypothetical protein C1Y08_23455 [Pseudomonas sp. FW306-02-F02-AA]PMZ19701.1 hypothetical protein C1Y09_22670 [Pseudomonas sp. FW306-02-F08-AA]PMZ29897.1 hypothetical protein C1Y05_01630 [Pseudomonas sp. FW306-02-F04-BA]PMZ32081.1 hypothetical protein C1X99_23235 [Pseudomo
MDFAVNNMIANLIESRLDSPEMARDSLHAALQFGDEFEQACLGSPLNGKAIREKLIPFRYGIESGHDYELRRLAKLLKADATFTLANMYLSGSDNQDICRAAEATPGCNLDLQLRGELFSEDIGL